MKKRKGFVSNSSSSSFILSVDSDEKAKISITKSYDLEDCGDYSDLEDSIRIKTVEELDNYVRESYWYTAESGWYHNKKEKYENLKEIIESGRDILILSLDMYNDLSRSLYLDETYKENPHIELVRGP